MPRHNGTAGPWGLLRATGFGSVLPLVLVAAVVALVYRDTAIEHLGPLEVQPALRVIVVVPTLLALACAIPHVVSPTPVVVRNARTALARTWSFVAALALSGVVLLLCDAFATVHARGAELRNFFISAGLAIATGALAGHRYAWVPSVTIVGALVLLPPADESSFSPGELLYAQTCTGGQMALASVIGVVGLTVGAWDPRSPGYLRVRRRRRVPAAGLTPLSGHGARGPVRVVVRVRASGRARRRA